MFVVIYSFKVKPGKVDEFKKAWSDLTNAIYDNAGSLGSRLHFVKEHEYIAYAQWPDKSTWQKAGDKLPSTSEILRTALKDSCEEIETIYELNVVSDLLRENVKS